MKAASRFARPCPGAVAALIPILRVAVLSAGILSTGPGALGQVRPVPPAAPAPGTIRPESIRLDARVAERVSRSSVTLVFRNPLAATLEGDFLFPLPPGVSVSDLTFVADGREMAGEIMEASAARRHYEDVVRRMKDPALLEYAGENLFRARVFPIPAGATRTVTLTFNHVLAADAGLVEFRFPVAGARLVPGRGDIRPVGFDPGGPERFPGITLDLTLSDRGEIGTVYSPTHSIDVERDGASRVRVHASGGQDGNGPGVRGDDRRPAHAGPAWPSGDFRLYYQLDPGDLGITLLTWDPGGEDGYFLALASPGAALESRERPPLSILFVLDTSGSMADGKLDEAREALEMALGSLRPIDRFGLIGFASEVDAFRDRMVEATGANVREARAWLDDRRPEGGTNIAGALAEASRLLAGEGLLFFLTDGQPTVGEKSVEGILRELRRRDAATGPHIFSVGVGYDVNTHLLSRLAEQCGGAVEYVTPDESVEEKVGRLLARTSKPLLSDVAFDLAGARVRDLLPARVPFLFAGEQVSFVGRFDRVPTGVLTAHIEAHRPGGRDVRVSRRITLSSARGGDFVARLWASRKVAFLLDEIRLHGETRDRIDELVEVAKRYGIVTPYTSYLADPEMLAAAPAERDEVALTRRALPSLREQSGAGAVSRGVSLDAMKSALDLAAPEPRVEGVHASGEAKAGGANPVRWVAGRAFYLRGDTWTEAAWPASVPSGRHVARLRPGSEGWFRLVREWPDAAPLAALGDRVRLVIGGTLLELAPDAANDLPAGDWSAIRAALPARRAP